MGKLRRGGGTQNKMVSVYQRVSGARNAQIQGSHDRGGKEKSEFATAKERQEVVTKTSFGPGVSSPGCQQEKHKMISVPKKKKKKKP